MRADRPCRRSAPRKHCRHARATRGHTPSPRMKPPLTSAVALAILVLCAPGVARAESVAFKDPLDDTPLEIKSLPHEQETEAVKEFRASGQNRYRTSADAQADGKELYERHCQTCH